MRGRMEIDCFWFIAPEEVEQQRMSNTLESVTAATKLRRDVMEVQMELEQKRGECRDRMDRVRERDEQLKADRAQLQEKLVQFYKYIQENEIKRNRANRKASSEEKAKQERHSKIVELTEKSKELEKQKQESKKKFLKYSKYQKYLEDVLQSGEANEEYQDAKEIISRWQTLDDNKTLLQRRKTQLEEELAKKKQQLNVKKQRKKNESVDLQNQLSELQNQLEQIQKNIKKAQDELDSSMQHKGNTTKTIGQVRMACQNLYDRCTSVNTMYKARHEEDQKEVLAQLTVIGDCLDDYDCIIKKHNEKKARDKQMAQSQGVKV
jgi:chromosome segregation ATPase